MNLLPKQNKKTNNKSEAGNVLFLILIAVALFAALSYAVTQSTRTGAGNNDSETALIGTAQLTQYPSSIRTSILRMIIGGVDATLLEFNPPSDFANCTPGNEFCVFHPSGGGANYAYAPTDIMASGGIGEWRFNGENEVTYIGTDGGAAGNADIIAFLPGVTQTICGRINQELGLPVTPPAETDAVYAESDDMLGPSAAVGSSGGVINGASNEFNGQPSGCFNDGGTFVYYQVLVER